jgi:hypothetical protein
LEPVLLVPLVAIPLLTQLILPGVGVQAQPQLYQQVQVAQAAQVHLQVVLVVQVHLAQ